MPQPTPQGHSNRSPRNRGKARPPVFFDAKHRRRVFFRTLVRVGTLATLVWFSVFLLGIYSVEKAPLPGLPTPPEAIPERAETHACPPVPAADARAGVPRLLAHYPAGQDWAPFSLRRDCGAVTGLLADLYGVDLPDPTIVTRGTAAGDPAQIPTTLRAEPNRGSVLPVLTLTAPGDDGVDALADPALRAVLAARIAALPVDTGAAGICLDPTPMGAAALPGFAVLFADLAARLNRTGHQTCLIAPAESPLLRDPVIAAADLVVLQAFLAPAVASRPGPLAAQAWFERVVAAAVADLGAERVVVAVGNFGYDWATDSPLPELVPYAEAMRRAARHQGQVTFSPDALNTTIRWTDPDGVAHEIWLLDAVSLRNQYAVLARLGVAGVALWSLGFEDPGVWPTLAAGRPAPLAMIEPVRLEDYVGYEGDGAFLRIQSAGQSGLRRLTPDPATGLILAQDYTRLPEPYTMMRYGAGSNGMVALTFDDGPDAKYTPAVLDALRAAQVPATFFLIGSNILKTPDTVRRMVAEGHEIGSHTFFHPEISAVSDLRSRLELNALHRLLAAVSGHSTALFRTPYGRGLGPLTAAEARPYATLERGGYLVAGSNVVPPDWEDVTPDAIVQSAMAQVRHDGGNVIVLHDGGGDRSATVAALPGLIAALRAQGHRFVPLSEVLGLDRTTLMPAETGARVTLDGWSFGVIGVLGTVLRAIFWVAIVVGSVRSLAILGLALIRRHYPVTCPAHTPSVTVVIPAFNEEDVIIASIATVLASDYPDLRLIVIDDGSQDHTYERVMAAYADVPRVTILRQPNQGKWMALDTAYGWVETDIVVAIDADTVILPDAIRKLVRPFADPLVGAVAGKVRVGNRGQLLTNLQALEYITAQNIDRRAAEVFNGMLVVPGAIGAWRAEAVRKAGLYTNETLAEDADLTVSVLRAGYRVVFEEEAVSITEAPETLRGFLKQRLRWTFGMMQTAWKHRRAAREGRAVGLISIPDLWLFGVTMALLAPVADLVFLSVVLDTAVDAALGRPLLQSDVAAPILLGYLALPVIEIMTALVAFGFERRSPGLLLLLPFQRIFYRQLLYITVYRAVWRALIGRIAGWGKLARVGTVQVPGE